ncbi:hypothetical protein [Candidatus Nitrosocosmicus sp. T]
MIMAIIKKDKSVKVFDWIKAAKLIKEYHIQNASVGFDLSGRGKTFTILKNGNPVKNNNYMIPLFDGTNPVLIDNDRRETMNCFVVIHENDDINPINIHPFESDKKMISLKWPMEALDIINRPFYRKDIQESKYFQLLMTNPIFYFWPLLGFV